jgi:hypothetical protein
MKKLNVVKDDSLLKMLPGHSTLNTADLGQIFGVSADRILERVTREKFPKWDWSCPTNYNRNGKHLWYVSTIKNFIKTTEA